VAEYIKADKDVTHRTEPIFDSVAAHYTAGIISMLNSYPVFFMLYSVGWFLDIKICKKNVHMNMYPEGLP
jgi:hypothetical protein